MASQVQASSAESKPLVKMSVFFNRKPGVSYEEFEKHWSQEHAKLFSGLPIVRKNLIRYNQYHVNRSLQGTLAPLGLPTVDFDGAADFTAVDLDSIKAIFSDPEYLKVVVPDEEIFIDKSSARFTVGYDETKWNRN